MNKALVVILSAVIIDAIGPVAKLAGERWAPIIGFTAEVVSLVILALPVRVG